MNKKRGLKHYLRFYGISSVLYLVYISFLAYREGGYDPALLLSLVYLPALFTLFLFVFDKIFDKILPSKEQKKNDEYEVFLKTTTAKVNEQLDLTIEDFRRLRESVRFQKSLYQAFQIKQFGENNEINFKFLEKKYKKDTKEYKALKIVLNEVKKMMVN